jgi:O-antigen/teichoic acid export membrane protein
VNDDRRVARNTIVLTAGKGLSDLGTFVFLVFFARRFGASAMGDYAFGMALGGMLTVLMGLGLNTLLERDVSRAGEKGPLYVGSLLPFQGAVGLLVVVGVVLLTRVWDLGAQGTTILFLITAYHILVRLTMVILAQFAAHQDLHYPAILDSGHKIVILVAGVVLAAVTGDPVATLAVYPAAGLLAFAAAVVLSSRAYGRPRFGRDVSLVKDLLSRSVSFFMIYLLLECYDRVGVVVLGAYCSKAVVGVYSVPDRLLTAVVGAVNMFETALFPAFCRLATGSPSEFGVLYHRAMRLMVILLIPAAAAVFAWSRDIVLLGFGDEYLDSTPILRVLSVSLLFVGLSTVVCSALVASNRETAVVKILLAVVACYGAASLLLIPRHGAMGLAAARLGSAVLMFLLPYAYMSRRYAWRKALHSLGPSLLSIGLAAAAAKVLAPAPLPVMIGGVVIVYVGAMIGFRGVTRDDVRYVRRLAWTK